MPPGAGVARWRPARRPSRPATGRPSSSRRNDSGPRLETTTRPTTAGTLPSSLARPRSHGAGDPVRLRSARVDPTVPGPLRSGRAGPVGEAPQAARRTSTAWGRSSSRGRLRWMRVPRSTWAMDSTPEAARPRRPAARARPRSRRPKPTFSRTQRVGRRLAGQGLADPGQVGEEQLDERPGHELGDPPPAGGLAVAGAVVEALDQGDVVVRARSGPSRPVTKIAESSPRRRRGRRRGRPRPPRGPPAWPGPCLAPGGASDPRAPAAARHGRGGVGRPVVDHQHLVDQAEPPAVGQVGAGHRRPRPRRRSAPRCAPGCTPSTVRPGLGREQAGGPGSPRGRKVARRLGHGLAIIARSAPPRRSRPGPGRHRRRARSAGRRCDARGRHRPPWGDHPERLRDGPCDAAATSAPTRAGGRDGGAPGANARSMRRTIVDHVTGLRCRECGRPFPAEALHVCDYCFGPLEVAYDYERIAAAISRERIAAGPRTIWRYRDLLPVADAAPVDLGAGFTPLVRADRLAAELGLGELWIKDDTANPTGSFKDRVVSVALTKARQLGLQGGGLRLDRQPGQLGGRPRGPGRDGLGRASSPTTSRRPRSVTTAVYGGTVVVGRGHLRRRQPAVRRADQRAPDVGVRQRQRPHLLRRGLQDPGLRGGRAARLAGARPRGRARRLGQPADQGGQGLRRAGHASACSTRSPDVRVSGAQAAGLLARWPPPSPRGPTPSARSSPSTIAKSLAIGNPADGWYALDAVRGLGRGLRRGHRRRDRRRHPPAGPHRGHLRRDRRRGDHRHPGQAGRARGSSAATSGWSPIVTGHGLKTVEALVGDRRPDRHHRPHPRGLRRRCRRRPDLEPAAGRRRPEEPPDERHRPHPHPAAHPDRRARARSRSRGRPWARSSRPSTPPTRASAERLFDDAGRAPALRQRLPGRRGRPLPRRASTPRWPTARPSRSSRPWPAADPAGRGSSPCGAAPPAWFAVSTRRVRVLTAR